jgi:hypothetical protein
MHTLTETQVRLFASARSWIEGEAVRWAQANRELIARRFIATLGAEAECLWDRCHNSIARRESDDVMSGSTAATSWSSPVHAAR